MTTNLEISVEGTAAFLTLRRPEKRNAITAAMWEGMVTGLAEVAEHEGVRALVVTGSGGSFSAGADLESVRRTDGSRSPDYQETALAGLAAIRAFPQPTLALIDGPCVGGGCSIALACDIRFASPGSIFAVPAVRYGFTYDDWSLRRLVELVGSGQASRFLLSATKLSGEQAAAIGLVEVCSKDVRSEVDSYLAALALGDPSIMRATRASIRGVADLGSDDDQRDHG